MRYVYHATDSWEIPGFRHGLGSAFRHTSPDPKSKAVEQLVFHTTIKEAADRGIKLFKKALKTKGIAFVPILLRVDLSGPYGTGTTLEFPIPVSAIEACWNGGWNKITDVAVWAAGQSYGIENGRIEDEDGNLFESIDDAARDARSQMLPRNP